MSELQDIATYIFTWHALGDACPTCRSLNGQEFRDQDIFQERLFSRIWGDIWDLDANHSLAHGIRQYNCRCLVTLRVEFDWSKWSVLKEMREAQRLFKVLPSVA